MSDRIDGLCDQLRIKLHGIDRRLEAIKGNGMATSEKSRHLIESQLDGVQQRIFDRRHAVEAANRKVTAWLDGKRAHFDLDVDRWKRDRQFLDLNSRADDAEDYAVAAFELAIAAADEAAHAALEALLARATAAALPAPPISQIQG